MPTAAAFAAADGYDINVQPEIEGNTAVRQTQPVTVSGTVPPGPLTAAEMVALDGNGAAVAVQPVSGVALNRGPAGPLEEPRSYLQNDNGQLSGRLTLSCEFGPTFNCRPAGTHVRQLAVRITVQGEPQSDLSSSNRVRVDYTNPVLRGYELVAPNRVRAIWSEPVRHPGGDLALDWEVIEPQANVLRVLGPEENDCDGRYLPGEDATAGPTGCTRTLVLDRSLHEDATPLVNYTLLTTTLRNTHDDFAGNVTFLGTPGVRSNAADLVRPAKPNIESVDGKTPSSGEVRSSSTQPTVRLTNLTPGHVAGLTVSGPGGTSQREVEVPQGANSVDIPVTVPGDGAYTFVAMATDPHGNTSNDTQKTPPRADGPTPTVRYIVDTLVPRALLATLTNRRTVEVVFTEPIVPAGPAGRWFVGDVPVTAEGSDDRRTLRSANDLNAPADGQWFVRWEPTSESAQPGTLGRYGDSSGNGLSAFQLPISDLPAVLPPGVTAPAQELYTKADRVTIAGTAPDDPNLVAELFDRGSEQPRSSAPVENGRWSIDQNLDADRRYEFEVRLRETQTGTTSPRVAVPDVVRDTTLPIVDVVFPDQRPLSLDNPTERKRQYGVGSSVPIRWRATDNAPGDPKRSDHGHVATITLLGQGNSRRVIADNIPHQPGQEQSYSYTLTQADLAGQGSRVLSFEVAVTDLATNRDTDTSSEILLLATLIGFRPALVQLTRIDVRFPVAVTGETVPGEWFVNEQPAQQATKTTQDGNTVVRLTVAQNSDPNWVPDVRYQPVAVNLTRLRSSDGTPVSTEGHGTADELAPALTAQTPNVGSRPIDADSVAFSGTTDSSPSRNTVFAYRTDAAGALQGAAIASTTAGTNGQWQIDVPLAQNTTNRIVVRASDPSGNVSATRPNPPFTVIEDSLAPVVQITSPRSASLVAPVFDITWTTVEANKESARIEYRVGGEPWQYIADRIEDTGSYRWEMPDSVQREIFSLRVTAFDQTDKSGLATVDGLRLDLEAPTILKARASGAQVVDVTFSEPVTLDGSGFTIGGATVRRVKGDGVKRTFILDRAVAAAAPQVEYSGTSVTDVAGNELEATSLSATRAFAFGVTQLKGQRVTTNRVRVAWTDSRNRPADLRGYRVYRDGAAIALVGASTRAFTDAEGKGRHVYSVRAVDDRRRVSSVRRVVVPR